MRNTTLDTLLNIFDMHLYGCRLLRRRFYWLFYLIFRSKRYLLELHIFLFRFILYFLFLLITLTFIFWLFLLLLFFLFLLLFNSETVFFILILLLFSFTTSLLWYMTHIMNLYLLYISLFLDLYCFSWLCLFIGGCFAFILASYWGGFMIF